MEISVANRMSEFEVGLNRLQNPSFISRLLSLAGIEEISLNYLWSLGALILALLATFSSMMNKTKFIVFRFWETKSVTSEHLLRSLVDDNDDQDESCSSCSSDDEDEPKPPFDNQRLLDEDFRVAGSCNYEEDRAKSRGLNLRRRRSSCCIDRFSWSDFTNGKNVVKLWEGLGLGLDFEDSSASSISMWDLNKGQIISSFSGVGCQIPAVSRTPPAVIVTAGLEKSRNVSLKVWDTRVGSQSPVVFAEWQPRRRGIIGVNSGGVDKVFVRGDANSLAVRDMRNVGMPLESLTESGGETWWDADAVIVSDGGREGCFDELLPLNVHGPAVSQCRDAFKSYKFLKCF